MLKALDESNTLTAFTFCQTVPYRTLANGYSHQPDLHHVQLRHRKLATLMRKRTRITTKMTYDKNNPQPRRWKCMKKCGACCKLDDYDEDVLKEMLRSEEDVVEYLGMIGTNGWCKWFDSFTRACTKYEERPRFCRATPEVFQDLYGVSPENFDEFATGCCEYHIENSYGEESQEAARYNIFKDLPYEQNRIYEVEWG